MSDNDKKPELRIVEMEDKEKSKALEAALSQIERAYGKGSWWRNEKSFRRNGAIA